MQILELIHTANALGAIAMIVVGSFWLKGHLRSQVIRCGCAVEKEA